MAKGNERQDVAVRSGYWPLFRYDPRAAVTGGRPLSIDSRKPDRGRFGGGSNFRNTHFKFPVD
jgi:pyruvate/2-oxoacid:ferredoxin oxidoreductase beta subunit